MRVDLFDFDLPEENIALRPTEPHDSARLLLVKADSSGFDDSTVRNLGDFLRPGDALVF
ncbi:S-adenosylmethionine:tRNA ribosyltransferase-isomerase, partial [Escherichia fergusonii]|nr:S-adenosylmethionine:tRNA ribosyltransferase-isomerase [Escherichia fergusonii]